MNSNDEKDFLKRLLKSIEKSFSSRQYDPDYVQFLEASETSFIRMNKEEFTTTFEEFGETFTTTFDVLGILENVGSLHIEAAILHFQKRQDQHSFDQLINSYYYFILLQLRAQREQLLASAVFLPDIVLSMLLSALYFPQDFPTLADYFSLYKQQEKELSPNLAGRSAVYTHLFPLYSFVVEKTNINDINTIASVSTSPAANIYQAAMDHVFSSDEDTVCNWVNDMVAFHIAGSKDDWTLPFNNLIWQYFPVEILSLLTLRAKNGLSNNFINNPLIKTFIPFIDQQFELSEKSQLLRSRV
ncbi:hypothetical protein [Taibaiella koreensis]|uniref:hypothetical protein n=1 Tax=Taibaiella koreensis TaxID=1268548 RepID=UPI000E5A0B50|nr:hypothetical protein [Taibaiella koreensis]